MSNPPPVVPQEDAQEVENFLDTYHAIAEWIRFADTKAAAVLTVIAALGGLLIPTLRGFFDSHPDGQYLTPWWPTLVVSLFILWLLLQALAGLSAFACITPFRRRGRHPVIDHSKHFHPASIAQHYTLDEYDRFAADCDKMGLEGFKREIMVAILIDAHISNNKYGHVSRAIRLLGISLIFALAYFLAIHV
jgi:hypothetical protein